MKTGFAKQSITPKFPVYLSGFAKERKSTGKLDDLYVKVMVIENDDELYGVFAYDLVGIDHLILDQVKDAMRSRNLKEENFLFAATHTHSGPGGILETRNGLLKPAEELFVKTDICQVNRITESSILALESAIANIKEASIYYATDTLDGVGDNRNNKNYKGDRNIHALFVEQEDGHKAVLLNYACHPTVLNFTNNKVSADFPGAIQKAMEPHGYDMSIYLNGSCGDISTRFSRQGSDEKEVLRYGKLFEEKLLQMREAANKIDIHEIKFTHVTKTLQLKKADTIEHAEVELDVCMKQLDNAIAQGISGSDLRLIESYKEGAEANLRLAKNAIALKTYDVNILFIEINQHFTVCVPGELFSELSNPYVNEYVNFVGYANGYVGYFADRIAYDQYCYEALSSPFEKGQGEEMMAYIETEIKRLSGKDK